MDPKMDECRLLKKKEKMTKNVLTCSLVTSVGFQMRSGCAGTDAVGTLGMNSHRRVALDVLDAFLAISSLWN